MKREWIERHKGSVYEDHLRVPFENLDTIPAPITVDQEDKEKRYESIDKALNEIFKEAATHLSDQAWQIFCLRWFFGFDNEEIGRQVEKTAAQIAVNLNNSYELLKTKMVKRKDLGNWISSLEKVMEEKKKVRQARAKKLSKGGLPPGVTVYSFNETKKPYRATIVMNGKPTHLGYYTTIKEAAEAVRFGENLIKKEEGK